MKKISKKIFLFIVVNVVVVCVFLEIFLRIFPQFLITEDIKDTSTLAHPYLTIWFKPSFQTTATIKNCWHSVVKFNEIGSRSLSISELKKKKEAWFFVGDSMVQGWQVNNEFLFISLLQEKLTDVAMYNLSKSGSSPVFYNRMIRYFLMKKPAHSNVTRIYYFISMKNDFADILFEHKDSFLRSFIRRNFYKLKMFLALRLIYEKALNGIFESSLEKREPISRHNLPFFAYSSESNTKALNIFTSLFDELKEISLKHHVKIIIVPIITVEQIMGGESSPLYYFPLNNLKLLAKKAGLDFYNLAEDMLRYQKINHLVYPYFSYKCDGHYSEFGHKIVADLLLKNTVSFQK